MLNVGLGNLGEVTLVDYTELTKAQAIRVLEMRNHPDIRKWMYGQDEISDAAHFKFIDVLKANESKKYYLVEQNGKDVGVIYLTDINRLKGSASLGLFVNLRNPQKRKGSILMSAIIKIAQENMRLKKLYLEVFSSNQRAINLYENFGFVEFMRAKNNEIEIVKMLLDIRA